MKVKALKDYFDLELNRAVKALDEFEVSAARARELAGADNKARQPLVEIIKATSPPTPKVAKGRAKKEASDQ